MTPRTAHRFITMSTLLIAILYWRFLPPTKSNSPDGNLIAALDVFIKHTSGFETAANIIENNPAFASYGKQIANGLRQYRGKITPAGNSLKEMHRKGSYLFGTFKTEIETLVNISDFQFVDISSFFKKRIEKMFKIVKELRTHIQKAKDAMLNVDDKRDNLEKDIWNGLREARKHLFKSYNDVSIVVDIPQNSGELLDKTLKVLDEYESESQSDVLMVVDIWKLLQNASKILDKILKLLNEYENNLVEVQAQLGRGLFTATKADLNYLIKPLRDLYKSHKKFIQEDSNPIIINWLWSV
ncbi:1848_t:CDS:2 [Paraglomus brasilianum]|uniref:1848_t:CDS:1 n=1 Tax=Paraglomus brasilianum TaxID=144538 RepID=A0A9N9A1T5_9GLOM|nr:1848_t:CDS:2 [Paraglomus brasilianum]